MKKSMLRFILPAMLVGIIALALAAPFSGRASESGRSYDNERKLTEKGYHLLNRELLNPLKKIYEPKGDRRIMSRCPSGVNSMMNTFAEGDQYFYGTVTNYTGCSGEKLCDFRISLDEETLEVMGTSDSSYVPVGDFKLM